MGPIAPWPNCPWKFIALMNNSDFCVVFITASNWEEGEKIARGLLEEKKAACVNVVSNVVSHYWWENKIETGSEVLLIVKTRKTYVDTIATWVKAHHSYTVPEVIAVPIIGGGFPYLSWLGETLP